MSATNGVTAEMVAKRDVRNRLTTSRASRSKGQRTASLHATLPNLPKMIREAYPIMPITSCKRLQAHLESVMDATGNGINSADVRHAAKLLGLAR